MIGWIVIGFLIFGFLDVLFCEFVLKEKCKCGKRTEFKNQNSEQFCEDCRKKQSEEEHKKNKAR